MNLDLTRAVDFRQRVRAQRGNDGRVIHLAMLSRGMRRRNPDFYGCGAGSTGAGCSIGKPANPRARRLASRGIAPDVTLV